MKLEAERIDGQNSNLSNLVSKRLKDTFKHILFELAKEKPIFIVDNKVYSILDKRADSDSDYFCNGFFRLNKKQVIELGDLATLEELTINREKGVIDEVKRLYLENILKSFDINEFDINDLDIPQLIYKYVFPHLRDNNGLIKILEDEEDVKGKRSLRKDDAVISDVDNIIKQLIAETVNEDKLKNRDYDLRDIYFFDNKVYKLIENYKTKLEIKINERVLYGKNAGLSVDDFMSNYIKNLSKSLRLEMLKKISGENLIKKILNDSKKLEEIKGAKEYSEGDFGFNVRVEGSYYIWMKLPTFAIKHNNEYYMFKGNRFGSIVDRTNSRDMPLVSPHPLYYVISPSDDSRYSHIYTKDHDNPKEFVPFCIGFNELPKEGSDFGEIIAKTLNVLKNFLIYSEEVGSNLNCCLKKNRVSYEELQKNKVEIIYEV